MEGRSKCAVAVMSGYGQRRAETLRLLGLEGASHAAPDKSRAGGVDARCAQLVRDINLSAKRASFYTTSSCSGRIVLGTDGMASDDDRDAETLVQQDRVKVMDAKLKTAAAASDVSAKERSDWALISHEKVRHDDVVRCIRSYITSRNQQQQQQEEEDQVHDKSSFGRCATSGQTQAKMKSDDDDEREMLVLRFEPFLLHCECVTLDTAMDLVDTARQAGLRNSGVSSSRNNYRHIAAIRSNVRIEMPLIVNQLSVIDEKRLDAVVALLVKMANTKLDQTHAQMDRFHAMVLERHCDAASVVACDTADDCNDERETSGAQCDARRIRHRQETALQRLQRIENKMHAALGTNSAPGDNNTNNGGVALGVPNNVSNGASDDDDHGNDTNALRWGMRVQKRKSGRVRTILRQWKCADLTVAPACDDSDSAVLTLPITDAGLQRLIALRDAPIPSTMAPDCAITNNGDSDTHSVDATDDEAFMRACLHETHRSNGGMRPVLLMRAFSINRSLASRMQSSPAQKLREALRAAYVAYEKIQDQDSATSSATSTTPLLRGDAPCGSNPKAPRPPRQKSGMSDSIDRVIRKGYELYRGQIVVLPECFDDAEPWTSILSPPDTSSLQMNTGDARTMDDAQTKRVVDALRTLRLHLLGGIANALGVNRVARQRPIQNNERRESAAELLYDPDNVGGGCTHVENGITYGFDVTLCMFSSGNGTERMRMATLLHDETSSPSDGRACREDLVVVDCYAGIGYFSVPILAHVAGVAKLYALEWNEPAFAALRENMRRNGIEETRYSLVQGDSRILAPRGVADHVLLGLIPDSSGGWPTAVRALREDLGGWLHVHGIAESGREYEWGERTSSTIAEFEITRERGWDVHLHHVERVKRYAPRRVHVVVDILLRPRPHPPHLL